MNAPAPYQRPAILAGVDVNYIQTDAAATRILSGLMAHLTQNHSAKNPYRIALDTETAPIDIIIQKRDRIAAQLEVVYDAFKAVPKNQPDERQAARAIYEEWLERHSKASKYTKRAGLHVWISQVRLVQIYDGGSTVLVFDRKHIGDAGNAALTEFLISDSILWMAHNAQFDLKMVSQHDMEPAHLPHCTLLMKHSLVSVPKTTFKLADLCKEDLGIVMEKEFQTSDWSAPVLSMGQIEYAAGDVVAVWRLAEKYLDELTSCTPRIPVENPLNIYKLQRGAMKAVNAMMLRGILFDAETHKDVAKALSEQYTVLRERVLTDFGKHTHPQGPVVENPGSTLQVATWLEYHLNISSIGTANYWPKTETGQLQSGKDALRMNVDQLDIQWQPPIHSMVEWANVKKAFENWGPGFAEHINPVTKRLHANMRLGGAESSRMSVTEPPLQTVNRENKFRELFIASPGYNFVIADLGQIEVRVPAAISKDDILIGAINRGVDIHTMTALACFTAVHGYKYETAEQLMELALKAAILEEFTVGQYKRFRQMAKAAIFGLIFGQGPSGLAELLGLSGISITDDEARNIQRNILSLFRKFRDWILDTREEAEKTGLIWTPNGRVYTPRYANQLYTKSINTPCQGGAAEIMLRGLSAFPHVFEQAGLDAHLVNVVHDEWIAEAVESDVKKTSDILEAVLIRSAVSMYPDIPQTKLVKIGHGETWAAAK